MHSFLRETASLLSHEIIFHSLITPHYQYIFPKIQ